MWRSWQALCALGILVAGGPHLRDELLPTLVVAEPLRLLDELLAFELLTAAFTLHWICTLSPRYQAEVLFLGSNLVVVG